MTTGRPPASAPCRYPDQPWPASRTSAREGKGAAVDPAELSTDCLSGGSAAPAGGSTLSGVRTPRPWILPGVPTPGAVLGAAGVTEAMLRSRLERSELVRLRPGVYVAAGSLPPGDQRSRHVLQSQAEQLAHPGSVLSHASAAAVWGLPCPVRGGWPEQGVHLTTEAGSRPRREGVVHHRGRLPAGQVTRDADGWPLTTAARTAVDLVRRLPLPQALVVLDAAARLACEGFVAGIRRKDYRNPGLVAAARELLAAAAATVRCRALQPAIALVEPCRESAIESLSAGHFELAGLPRPLFQEAVRTRYGVYYPDCYWPEQRLIGEADGAVKYADQTAFVREKEREQELRDAGYRFVRWLGREIHATPSVVVERSPARWELAELVPRHRGYGGGG